MIALGFIGPSGSGKGVAVDRLRERWRFHRVHVGQAVKDACAAGLNLSHDQVDGHLIDAPADELGGAAPRAVLEAVGKAMHDAAPLAKGIRLKADLHWSGHQLVVVDGIRSQEDADAARAIGAFIVRIVRGDRPGDPNKPMDVLQAPVPADLTITNDGTVYMLQGQIDAIAQRRIARSS